jgi:hypothetical protein
MAAVEISNVSHEEPTPQLKLMVARGKRKKKTRVVFLLVTSCFMFSHLRNCVAAPNVGFSKSH